MFMDICLNLVKRLVSLGGDHVDDLVEEGNGCDLKCHFCNETHVITHHEMLQIQQVRLGSIIEEAKLKQENEKT